MKTLTLFSMALVASGCAGMKVSVFDPTAHAPSAVAIAPLTLDCFTPREARHERSVGKQESILLAESVRAVGAAVVVPQRADYTLGGTVLRAVVDERVQFAFSAGSMTSYGTHFKYTHYELDLRLTDSSGRLVASAHATTDDDDGEALGRTMRATLRQLLASFPRA
jgi:hypothetical protein